MASVTLEGISKSFGSMVVIENLSLAVNDGEFLVLLGPSGCGKTTALRITAGFIEATKGRLHIGERDVTREPPYRRNIGLVFQNYALFPHLSVFENVAFGLRRRGTREADIRRKVAYALELVRLAALAERLPRQLSGGQQQRVAIARAIVIEPDVLLLDEPLSNLDAKLRLDVRQELRRLQQTLGMTTIMVTHDQDEAMSVGDRLVVINQGRIQQIGGPAELYKAPASRFVASFIGRANFLPGVVEAGHFVTSSGLRFHSHRLVPGADTLMVRPEMVELTTATMGPAAGLLPATVRNSTFLGASYDIELQLDGGDALTVVLPAKAASAGDVAVGSRVFIRIDPADAVGIRS